MKPYLLENGSNNGIKPNDDDLYDDKNNKTDNNVHDKDIKMCAVTVVGLSGCIVFDTL